MIQCPFRSRAIGNSLTMPFSLLWSKHQSLGTWLMLTELSELLPVGLLTSSEMECYSSLSLKSLTFLALLRTGDQLPARWRAGLLDKLSTPWISPWTHNSPSIFHLDLTSKLSTICSLESAMTTTRLFPQRSRKFVRSTVSITGMSHPSPGQLESSTSLLLTSKTELL